jgi:mono/diheme cytochrome c family protein
MHDCDVTLKALLTDSLSAILRQIGEKGEVAYWLNAELPVVRNQRADLLVELTTGEILHIDLQSSNDPDMPFRMLEYAVAIRRTLGKFPRQLVLYAGNPKMTMKSRMENASLVFHYHALDIREVDSEALLTSESISDNLPAILARTSDKPGTVHRIIGKIARLAEGRREDVLRKLLILSGMRCLAGLAEKERKSMPVTFDIMDNEVPGPLIRKGIEQGIGTGREQGVELGMKQILRAMVAERFGTLLSWAEEKLSAASVPQTNAFAMKLPGARSKICSAPGRSHSVLPAAAVFAQTPNPGRTEFEGRCSVCHGADGTGGEPGPAIVNRLTRFNDAELAKLIRNGLPARGMPGSPLTDPQLNSLVMHLRTFQRGRSAPVRLRCRTGRRSKVWW